MRKLFSLIVITIFSTLCVSSVFGQYYVYDEENNEECGRPLLENGKTWIVLKEGHMSPGEADKALVLKYEIVGDTIVRDLSCKILHCVCINRPEFNAILQDYIVRELNKCVFVYHKEKKIEVRADNDFYMTYINVSEGFDICLNFNLWKGAILYVGQTNMVHGDLYSGQEVEISEQGSIELEGEVYKTLTLGGREQREYPNIKSMWIEGIGSTVCDYQLPWHTKYYPGSLGIPSYHLLECSKNETVLYRGEYLPDYVKEYLTAEVDEIVSEKNESAVYSVDGLPLSEPETGKLIIFQGKKTIYSNR